MPVHACASATPAGPASPAKRRPRRLVPVWECTVLAVALSAAGPRPRPPIPPCREGRALGMRERLDQAAAAAQPAGKPMGQGSGEGSIPGHVPPRVERHTSSRGPSTAAWRSDGWPSTVEDLKAFARLVTGAPALARSVGGCGRLGAPAALLASHGQPTGPSTPAHTRYRLAFSPDAALAGDARTARVISGRRI